MQDSLMIIIIIMIKPMLDQWILIDLKDQILKSSTF